MIRCADAVDDTPTSGGPITSQKENETVSGNHCCMEPSAGKGEVSNVIPCRLDGFHAATLWCPAISACIEGLAAWLCR